MSAARTKTVVEPQPSAASTPGADEPADPLQWLTADVLVEAGDWSAAGDIDTAVTDTVAALWRSLPRAQVQPSASGVLLATIVFETDAAVQALNRQFRRQDKPTNVLSFPAALPPPDVTVAASEPVHIGDVILAAETVMREARELAIAPKHHVHHLVLHGLLHLLGHDHDSDAAALRMEALETSVLATLGIADPYAGSEPT
jgi:probable rRNA maturation factor